LLNVFTQRPALTDGYLRYYRMIIVLTAVKGGPW